MPSLKYLQPSVLLCFITLLMACSGGSDSSSSDPIPSPPANSLPIANNDSVSSENDQAVTIDVLANDSDADNDALSISAITTEPKNGQAELIDGKIQYTPNAGYAGPDTFSYQISDGTSNASANVEVAVSQTFMITGSLLEDSASLSSLSSAMDNAVVTEASFEQRNFSAKLTITKGSEVFVKSETTVNERTFTLYSGLLKLETLLAMMNAERQITSDELSNLNISFLSTSSAVEMFRLKSNLEDQNDLSHEQALQAANPKSVFHLLGIYKLLSEFNEFEGFIDVEPFEFFTTQAETSIDALISQQAIDLGIDLLTLEQAIEAAQLTAFEQQAGFSEFNPSALNTAWIAAIPPTQVGMSADNTRVYHFTNDGNLRIDDDTTGATSAQWSVESGQLAILKNEVKTSFEFLNPDVIFDDVFRYFGNDVAMLLFDINRQTSAFTSFEIIEEQLNEDIQIYEISDSAAHVVKLVGSTYRLRFSESFTRLHPELADISASQRNFVSETWLYNQNSVFTSIDMADFEGNWAMPLLVGITPNLSEAGHAENKIYSEKINFSENGQSAFLDTADDIYEWSLNQGVLTLNNVTFRFEIIPFERNGKELIGHFSVYENDQLIRHYVSKMIKFDSSGVDFAQNASRDLPTAYAALLGRSSASLWKGGMLPANSIRAYTLLPDTTALFAIRSGVADENSFDGSGFYAEGNWTWRNVVASNVIDLENLSDTRSDKVRTWEIIATEANGRIHILEQELWYSESDPSPLYLDGVRVAVSPRINTHLPIDLSDWDGAWSNRDF
ncbi:Ig-like domain-containing protein [Ningiella sp. W23]|uniref:Ig-like domain-containing protein n=1 Tax=Ningiella sp. W23 TaxID=3023715 RepID=UPI0037577F75